MFSARKLLQNSEETLPPIHIPLILGQDFFILTYQDQRKIEASRLFTFRQLMPNGALEPLNMQNMYEFLLQILKQENLLCNQNVCQFLEFLNNKRSKELQEKQQYYSGDVFPTCPQPMEVSVESCRNPALASIEQQLQWDRCVNTSKPFPLTCSLATSTTELNYQTQLGCQESIIIPNPCNSKNRKHFCNKSINTFEISQEETNKSHEILGAREQLKKKKQNSFYNF